MSDPYNVTLLDGELKAAGLLIDGCSSTGRIDWTNPPTASDLATADAVLKAHDPKKLQPIDALKAKIKSGTATQQELTQYLILRDGL